VSLCSWERHLMLFPIMEPSSLPIVVAQPDERHANITAAVLEWYDRHRTKAGHLDATRVDAVQLDMTDLILRTS